MKKAYQYIALAALALSFAACTQEDDYTPQGNQKDAPLAIASAGVAELTTRATINNNNLEGGSIGVYVNSETGGRYSGDNIKWTYGNDGWQLEDATVVLYENNGEKQQIAAYYPYNENLGTGNVYSITLPEAYGEDYENYDYLYGEYAQLSDNPSTIALNHLMAKVTVSIQATGTEIGGDNVKSISLMNVPHSASWTVPTNVLEDLGTANQVIALYANDTNNDQTVDNYVGYALPDAATTLGIRVTMNSGRSFAAQAPITGGLASGNHYLISMKLGKDAVTVGNITIGDWGTPESNPTGSEATEIFNSTVSGETAAIDIVSSAAEGVQNAISELLTANPSVTTLTVNGMLNEAQQSALATALADFSGTLVMDMTEVVDAIKSLACTKQLGGYTVVAHGTTTTYTVYTEAGLNVWREAVAENDATNLTLGADIILSTDGIEVTNDKPSGSNWTPIGTSNNPFTGTIDGGGHTLSGLRISSTTSDTGFIGYLGTGGAVKNLTLANAVVYSMDYKIGTVVGANLGTMENCHVAAGSSVSTVEMQAGGIVGNNFGLLMGCTHAAAVKGTDLVGGIAGANGYGGSIIACANTGTVDGTNTGLSGNGSTYACWSTASNDLYLNYGSRTACYIIGTNDGSLTVSVPAGATSTAADNIADAITAMNAAIVAYNANEENAVKCPYTWQPGTDGYPTLVKSE